MAEEVNVAELWSNRLIYAPTRYQILHTKKQQHVIGI